MFKRLSALFLMALLIFTSVPIVGHAAGGLELYTAYTGISVTPGDTVNYKVEVINNTSEIQNVTFETENLPKDFKIKMTGDSWELHKLAVKPGKSQTINVDLTVPLKINKGTYTFDLVADGQGTNDTLPISVTVTEKGTYQSGFKVDQDNMEGTASQNFDFTATLQNHTAKEQRYALTSAAPGGWDVQFKTSSKSVTSVKLDPNTKKDITVHVDPPKKVKAGNYEIPIKATSGSTSAETTLHVVITGTYEMTVSTPNGNLSTDITAGSDKQITLVVQNTGSGILRDVKLESSTPNEWTIEYDPGTIKKLEPGQTKEITATIHASDKAIAGDYVVNVNANSDDAYAEAKLRVTVKTSLLWGWLGVVIILVVLGGIYYLIRRYGRR